MRAEAYLVLLGMSCSVLAGERAVGDAPPDAALLEFLADWQEEDQQWLETQMQVDEQSGNVVETTQGQE